MSSVSTTRRYFLAGTMALTAWVSLLGMVRADSIAMDVEEPQLSVPEPSLDFSASLAQRPGGQTAPETRGGAVPSLPPQAMPPAPPTGQTTRSGTAPAPQDLGLLGSLFGNRAASNDRLAAAPNMFGDFYANSIHYDGSGAGWVGGFDVPLAGGAGRPSVADNNNALTQDRVYMLYNHYHNALRMDIASFDPNVPTYRRRFSVDRYTLGFEKSFADGAWSGELRLPLTNGFHAYYNNGDADLLGTGGSLGNLTLVLKRMLHQTDSTAISMGLGIGMPTGSDAQVTDTILIVPLPPTVYKVHNDAVNLVPYVAITNAPTDRLFYTGFFQVDVPTNGNAVDTFMGPEVLYEETLLHVDLQGGYWLWRRPEAPRLRGLATVAEIHYTGFLTGPYWSGNFTTLLPPCDLWNLTIGLHAELAESTILRVGAAFPLSNRTSEASGGRAFDAEVQMQLERRF